MNRFFISEGHLIDSGILASILNTIVVGVVLVTMLGTYNIETPQKDKKMPIAAEYSPIANTHNRN